MQRCSVIAEAAVMAVFVMGFGGAAVAQPQDEDRRVTHGEGDPNIPVTGGDVRLLAPQADGITRYIFGYNDPGILNNPFVKLEYNGRKITSTTYLGYNDEGSWLSDRGTVYTIKNGTITNRHLEYAQLPKNLRNGSPTYLADFGTANTPAAPPSPPVRQAGAGASGSAARNSVPAALSGVTGTEARIERRSGAVTLSYRDGEGKGQSYRVARPNLGVPREAAKQLDATDAGAWLYSSADGKSGILFTLKADGTLTALPLAAPMIAKLAGRGN
jgi:hypothetical protein